MIPPLIDMTPQSLADELLELGRETLKGIESLSRVDAGSIQVGFTPKTAVWQREGVTLYRYTPRVETPKPVPLLISYALVNRPYMVDLEPGRSMVQSLLDLVLDV